MAGIPANPSLQPLRDPPQAVFRERGHLSVLNAKFPHQSRSRFGFLTNLDGDGPAQRYPSRAVMTASKGGWQVIYE